MPQPQPQSITVSHPSDGILAQNASKTMALSLGFNVKASEEVALVAREIASNLVKHATQGTLTLTPLLENGRQGIQMESLDSGPGIADIDHALADGFSTAGSLGCGLGAVNRLMDQLEITSHRSSGTRLVCRRWLREDSPTAPYCPMEFGAASRPRPGLAANGDAFVIKRWGESALLAVIDGLGHGQPAHLASKAARQYVESHFDQPLLEIFRGAGRTCRSTRGVVMALARFDWAEMKLTFGSVGNVESRVFNSPQPINFVVRRGIVGYNAPNPVVSEHRWNPGSILILHSDGVSSRWRWEDFGHLSDKPTSMVAQQMLGKLAKEEDDATILVAREAPQ